MVFGARNGNGGRRCAVRRLQSWWKAADHRAAFGGAASGLLLPKAIGKARISRKDGEAVVSIQLGAELCEFQVCDFAGDPGRHWNARGNESIGRGNEQRQSARR